jgi:glucose/arabinose dehydrogenase
MRWLAAILLALAFAAPASAEPSLTELGRFQRPVDLASPPGDLRVFVVQQGGQIRVLDTASGALLPQPFLDVSAEIATDNNERGLLGLAFAPDYATSGLFYVFLTASSPAGQVQIREYRRAAGSADRADPASLRIILRQDHPVGNHNGGGLRFGPDGKLWATIGDGGSQGDPENDAQTPVDGNLLGKLLRIDQNGAAVPGNRAGTRIFHYGLRNPWRFSFDRQTGDLVIADVGASGWEEVDFAPASEGWLPGQNWGWHCWEGTHPTPGVSPACDPPDDRFPILEKSHGSPDNACSITGGVVVRDPGLPTLAGRYLYGDQCWSTLRSAQVSATAATGDRAESRLAVSAVTTFAEDACGRVLTASLNGGVYRVVDGTPTACAPAPGGGGPGGGPPSTPVPAVSSCGLQARAPKVRRRATALRSGIPVVIRVHTRCRVSATAHARNVGTLVARAKTLVPGQRATLRLRAGRRTRAALRRHRSVRFTITLTARTDSGATSKMTRRTRVRR